MQSVDNKPTHDIQQIEKGFFQSHMKISYSIAKYSATWKKLTELFLSREVTLSKFAQWHYKWELKNLLKLELGMYKIKGNTILSL